MERELKSLNQRSLYMSCKEINKVFPTFVKKNLLKEDNC